MTGNVHAHRNDGEEAMPAAFLGRTQNGESTVAVGDGPGGVSAAMIGIGPVAPDAGAIGKLTFGGETDMAPFLLSPHIGAVHAHR